jgi:hypothetical protein
MPDLRVMTHTRRRSLTDAWISWLKHEYHLAQEAVSTPPSILAIHLTFHWRGRTNLCPDTYLTTSRDLTPETLFKDFDRVYRRMLPPLIGRHYENPSKRHLQPRTAAFIDLPNTRARVPDGRCKTRTQYNPHVHAVMIVRADLAAKIPDGTLNIFFCDVAHKALGDRLDSIHVDQIPPSDIGAVTGYAAKLTFRDITGIHPTDLYHVWPRALSERGKNNRSWDVSSTPKVPQQRTRRQSRSHNHGRDLKREIYANPSAYTGRKLDAIITLVDHAPQLEALYSTAPSWCCGKFEEAFRIMLHGQEEDVWRFIQACRAQWDTLSLLDIAASATCSDLAKYATGDPAAPYRPGTPIHLQSAIVYNAHLDSKGLTGRYNKIKDGDQIKYLLLFEPNPLRAPAIGFSTVLPQEFGLDGYVDSGAQFDVCFRQPLNRALAMVGWLDKKKRTLGVLDGRRRSGTVRERG